MYVAKPPFYLHMGFVYLLAAAVTYILFKKMCNVPKIYGARYRNMLIVILVISFVTYVYVSGNSIEN